MRSAWENGLPCHLDVLETQLDGIFQYLGVNSSLVDHSISLTEPLMNPKSLRESMTELLFEGYGFKQISLLPDPLTSLSAFSKKGKLADGIVAQLGHNNTWVYGIKDGKMLKQSAQRLPLGGLQIAEYLLKSMILKYPSFPQKMTLKDTFYVLKKECQVAENYGEMIKALEDVANLVDFNSCIQYPYPEFQSSASLLEDEAHLRAEEERRQVFRDRMRSLAEQKKLERLANLERQIAGMLEMREKKELDEDEFEESLRQLGYDDEQDFDNVLRELTLKRNKILGVEDPPQVVEEKYDWSLLAVPDVELDASQLKEKRKLRLLKAGVDSRERQKQAKLALQKEQEEQEQREQRERDQDMKAWLSRKYQERRDLMEKLDVLEKAKSGRKGAASARRLQKLSYLAAADDSDAEETPAVSKKKRKSTGAAGVSSVHGNFGDDGKDWDLYRDEDDQEDLESRLGTLNDTLAKYDPHFMEESQLSLNLSEPGFQLFEAFHNGILPGVKLSEKEQWQASWQLHISTEKIKIPEILFQPFICGMYNAGLSEMIFNVSKRHPSCSHNIYLTGGNSQLKGMKERIVADFTSNSASGHVFNTHVIKSPWDSWKGAAANDTWMCRKNYEEHGFDRIIVDFDSKFFI